LTLSIGYLVTVEETSQEEHESFQNVPYAVPNSEVHLFSDLTPALAFIGHYLGSRWTRARKSAPSVSRWATSSPYLLWSDLLTWTSVTDSAGFPPPSAELEEAVAPFYSSTATPTVFRRPSYSLAVPGGFARIDDVLRDSFDWFMKAEYSEGVVAQRRYLLDPLATLPVDLEDMLQSLDEDLKQNYGQVSTVMSAHEAQVRASEMQKGILIDLSRYGWFEELLRNRLLVSKVYWSEVYQDEILGEVGLETVIKIEMVTL